MTEDGHLLAGEQSPQPRGLVERGREDEGLAILVVHARRDPHMLHAQTVVTQHLGVAGLQIPAHHLPRVVAGDQVLTSGREHRLAHRGLVDANLPSGALDHAQLRKLHAAEVVDTDAFVRGGDGDPPTCRVELGIVGRPAERAAGRKDHTLGSRAGLEDSRGAVARGRNQQLAVRREGKAAHLAGMHRRVPERRPGTAQIKETDGIAVLRRTVGEGEEAAVLVQRDRTVRARAAAPVGRPTGLGREPPDAGLADPQDRLRLAAADEPHRVDGDLRTGQVRLGLKALPAQRPKLRAFRPRLRHQALPVVSKRRRQGLVARHPLGLDHRDHTVRGEGATQGIGRGAPADRGRH